MAAGSSPGTSEMMRVHSRAGSAAWASRPPLMAESWRRSTFISLMVAPLASRMRLSACLSASVMPGPGSVSNDEPPPEMSATTRSSGPRPCTACRMRVEACTLASSGTGCAACSTSMRPAGTAWP